tara:strand:- start:278 stop:475 length:198 start_codon:yes stop_codon:yes gene_type:complete
MTQKSVKIELTKKEFEFLHDWLEDDLDIQIRNSGSMNQWGENKLKSIVKKFRKEVENGISITKKN